MGKNQKFTLSEIFRQINYIFSNIFSKCMYICNAYVGFTNFLPKCESKFLYVIYVYQNSKFFRQI